MEKSVINGVVTVEKRVTPSGKKQMRKIVVFADDDGKTYAIPVQYLSPVSEYEEKLTSEVENLKEEIKNLAEEGKEEVKTVLDKKYFGLSGKEIAIGLLFVLIISKI